MLEFSPASVDSRISLHEAQQWDLEYDVYLFWPSNGGLSLSPGQDFVHTRIPYTASIHSSAYQAQSDNTTSLLSSSSVRYTDDGQAEMGTQSRCWSKFFSFGFLTPINHRIRELINKVRRNPEPARSPSTSL